VFVAVLAAGFVFLVVGRYRWFFHDEWDFLAGRDGGDIADLLISHNEHWSTLPILAYRALYRAVGLRSYAPYRALLLALHLTAAVLLRVIMRRSGVNPWIATAAAAVFVLFGSGYANLLWAFQIGFVGALVFGLAHLLLADHDGPVDRRDGFALVAGLAGLLSSAVALTMIPVVGLSVMIRRGWQVALLHTAPFAVLYVAWLAHYRDQHTSGGVGYTPYDISGPRELARFVERGARAAVEAMVQLPGAGWALVALLAVGLPLAYGRLDWAQRRTLLSAPASLLVGAFLFFVVSGVARAARFGAAYAEQSRYLYLFAALALPAVAIAADAIARRWRLLFPAMLVLLLAGIPGNVHTLLQQRSTERAMQLEYRRLILTLPRVPVAARVPPSMRPEQQLAKPLTLGWLLDGVRSGRVPKPSNDTPVDRATASLHLALYQQPDAFGTKACRNRTTPLHMQLKAQEAIGIHGVVQVVYTTPTGTRSRPVTYEPDEIVVVKGGRTLPAPRLLALTGPLTLDVDSANPHTPVDLCL
jgi:hypothetical protein